jgi:hypothetical protein
MAVNLAQRQCAGAGRVADLDGGERQETAFSPQGLHPLPEFLMLDPAMNAPILTLCLGLAANLVLTAPAPAATLVSHWSFDDATATDTVSAQNGTFQNGATTSTTETAGAFGGRSLDVHDVTSTTNQHVRVVNSSTINYGNDLSISFWMKANYDGEEASFGQPTTYTRPLAMNAGATTDPGWEFQRSNDAVGLGLRVDTDASGNQTRTGTNTAFDGDWHHIVVTMSDGAIFYYFDGANVSPSSPLTHNLGAGFGSPTANLVFGATSSGGSQFDGWLDDISLWSTEPLTAGEAIALYSLGSILGYDASDAEELYALHEAGTGTAEVNGLEWRYVDGLSGTAGEITTIGAEQVLFLTSTTGVAAAPEPGRSLLLLIAATVVMFRRRRR